jgi:hypothetical protein
MGPRPPYLGGVLAVDLVSDTNLAFSMKRQGHAHAANEPPRFEPQIG